VSAYRLIYPFPDTSLSNKQLTVRLCRCCALNDKTKAPLEYSLGPTQKVAIEREKGNHALLLWLVPLPPASRDLCKLWFLQVALREHMTVHNVA